MALPGCRVCPCGCMCSAPGDRCTVEITVCFLGIGSKRRIEKADPDPTTHPQPRHPPPWPHAHRAGFLFTHLIKHSHTQQFSKNSLLRCGSRTRPNQSKAKLERVCDNHATTVVGVRAGRRPYAARKARTRRPVPSSKRVYATLLYFFPAA